MLALVLGFLGQRGQCAFYGQAGADQARELAGPYREAGGVEDRAREPSGSAGAALALACGDGLDLQRHQGLAAQLAARGTGVVGFQGALAGLALGIQGFKGKGGHARIDLTGEGLMQIVATNDVSTSAFERASPA